MIGAEACSRWDGGRDAGQAMEKSAQSSGFFRCVHCGGGETTAGRDRWTCVACRRDYPAVQGVPLLVRDWEAHSESMAQARSNKPGWYCEVQPDETVSPWRHHIRKRRQYIESAVARYLERKRIASVGSLLDLGCGDGNHLGHMSQYGRRLFGTDYNIDRLLRARARFPSGTFFLGDTLDLPVKDEFFDLVFFHHVIEHIEYDEGALATIHRILKKGGLLVLGAPNEGAWWWQLAYTLQPKTRKTTDHVHFYTAEKLSDKVRRSGLNVAEVKHIGYGLPHWSLDALVRQHKWAHDLLDSVGKRVMPRQASSLYILAEK